MPYVENEMLERWLAQERPEPVLEPELPIVDPHHHLWDIRKLSNPPYVDFAQKVYLCEEISNEIRDCGHNIVQTVFAQCGAFYRAQGPQELRCVGETEFVQGVVAMSQSGLYGQVQLCAGIFGSVDLRVGAQAATVLEAHLRASKNFRGVRTAFPSDLNASFLEGFAQLSEYGLSYDNYSPDFERLPTLARLAQRFPDVPVIVNHLGGTVIPDASRDALQRWQSSIDAIAKCPNAVMKCGGGQMRVGDWEPPFHINQSAMPLDSESLCDALFPYYEYVIGAFGPQRCMFESNFPVDKECVSYRTLWNMFKRIAEKLGLSAAEKSAIFGGTAARVYRLGETA